MSFELQFNALTVAPNIIPEPIPTGIYDVAIIGSKEVAVKNGNGNTFYELTMNVIGGEFNGRKVIERLNVKNSNQQAVDIALATLSSICYVTGVMVIQQSSAELHGKPFKVSVAKTERSDDKTKFGNEIRGYMDTMGNEPGKAAASVVTPSGFGQQTAQQPQQTQQAAFGQVQQTAVQQQPVATQMTQAVDPRLIAMIQAGVPAEQAVALVAAQDAAAATTQTGIQKAPDFVAPQTQAAQATQAAVVQGGPTPADIAAQAMASLAGQNGAAQAAQQASPPATGGADAGAVPSWAQ